MPEPDNQPLIGAASFILPLATTTPPLVGAWVHYVDDPPQLPGLAEPFHKAVPLAQESQTCHVGNGGPRLRAFEDIDTNGTGGADDVRPSHRNLGVLHAKGLLAF